MQASQRAFNLACFSSLIPVSSLLLCLTWWQLQELPYIHHVHWRTNRKLTQKWQRLGLIKLEICVWILLWWIWSHSAHYKPDVGHLLETRGVAHYLPFSLVPPCYHVREVDLSKYVPAQSGHLGWKLAWVRSHEMQREKWKGEIRSLRWSQQPKSQIEFSSSRKDSR